MELEILKEIFVNNPLIEKNVYRVIHFKMLYSSGKIPLIYV